MPQEDIEQNENKVSPTIMLAPPSQEIVPEEEKLQLISENEELKRENEALKKQIAASTASAYSKSKAIHTEVDAAHGTITLFFQKNEAGMLPEVQVAIAKFLQSAEQAKGHVQVEMTASMPESLGSSRSREIALTRAMIIRNILLDIKVKAEDIHLNYSSEMNSKSSDWVQLKVIPAVPHQEENR